MVIDCFNSGIGKVPIALDCPITILTSLQFAELHLSVLQLDYITIMSVLCIALRSL